MVPEFVEHDPSHHAGCWVMDVVKRAIQHAQVLKPSVERAGERCTSAVVMGHCVCSKKLGLTLPFPSPLSDFLPQNPMVFHHQAEIYAWV